MQDNKQKVEPQALTLCQSSGPAAPAVHQPAVAQAQPASAAPIKVMLQTARATQAEQASISSTQPTTPGQLVSPSSTKAPTAISKSTASSPVKVYRQRVHGKDSTSKHTPIAPRGTVILERDNPGLCRKHFRKGAAEPDKLKLTLVDTKGNLHKRFFADKDSMDWNDAIMIANANKWRNQVLRRIFKKDATFKGRTIRAKWGLRETGSLKTSIEQKVKAVGGRRLNGEEWKELMEEHNARFAGSKVFKGERLLGGQKAKTEEMIEKRTVVAIKALFNRNADLKQFMNDLVGNKAADSGEEDGNEGGDGDKGGVIVKEESDEHMQDEDEDESQEESPKKKRRGYHSGVINPRLEDPSDDEDGGQRPASNPVGAVLVSEF